ncbi:MAG: alpha/beta fold hydrolase [Marmoricola sp.]|nr:alpha/beta fold hydrolase [Marmoricola sp.]
MTFPPLEPRETGLLRVLDGAELFWEVSGVPDGKPVLWLHGGPGTGLGDTYRRRLDPGRWNVVGFDQRGCGRSRPLATTAGFDLETLSTQRHVEDVEALREHLGIERWLVAGGSWGSTLALAYAEEHPERVSEIVLVAVTTSARVEIEWISERVGRIFPRQWAELEDASGRRPGQPLLEAMLERLTDPDPAVRDAAALAWCRWEDTHVSLDPAAEPYWQVQEPDQRLLMATHVVNNWAHTAWLGESGVLDRLDRITHLPAVLIHGRLDVSGPLVTAWELHRRWPASRLVVVEGEGHGGTTMSAELEAAYASFLP